MDMTEDIERIEQSAKAAGLSMRAACIRAGIHPTTVSRWKAGVSNPLLETLRKLEAAIAAVNGTDQAGRVSLREAPAVPRTSP